MDIIPKKIFFYWNSEKLSWMRYMTLFSFRKLNPDWDMTLYLSDNANVYNFRDSKQDFLQNFEYDNYFSRISDLNINVKKAEFQVEHQNLLSHLNPIQESDVFRYYKLYDDGGFYSDMDILFIRPMDILYDEINIQKSDTVIYQDSEHIAIGFLGSSKNNEYYKFLYDNAFGEKGSDYQSHGVIFIGNLYGSPRYTPTLIKKIIEKHPNLNIYNLSKERFYQHDWRCINKMFTNNFSINDFSENTIGYHWYGGGELPQKLNTVLTEKNYQDYKITFCNLAKRILP